MCLQEPTIGAAFFTQILSLSEATVKFDIWDTAGQERYHSLAPMYYRGAAAAIVVYDMSSIVSFGLVEQEKDLEILVLILYGVFYRPNRESDLDIPRLKPMDFI